MISDTLEPSGAAYGEGPAIKRQGSAPAVSHKGSVLVVDDEQILRESMRLLLEEDGYEVLLADSGRTALAQLHIDPVPDIILLDLKMPVMNGWEFRTIQKDDPRLGRIPVIALSADGSAQAAAISADAYLRKPVGAGELLATVKRVLFENNLRLAAQMDETERLAELGRLAAGVGHEINNPLAFVMVNINQCLEALRPWNSPPPDADLLQLKARVADIVEMLDECQIGVDRIGQTVGNLQRLSRQREPNRGSVDVHRVIEQSVSMVWTQIRHRARLIKTFGKIPLIRGDAAALGQVFMNLFVNAAQALPEGAADRNEIRIFTGVEAGQKGPEIVVEISDSGTGMAPEVLSHVFEPFFTTKAMGQGTGLGLSISRQTILDHGGRIDVASQVGKGTVFRIVLPVGDSLQPIATSSVAVSQDTVVSHGRILVVDDEPLIGRVIRNTLKREHDVVVVATAGEALRQLEQHERFDLVICDVLMPDLSGPQFHAIVAERWPSMVNRLVFMTGGAFTPGTAAFLERMTASVFLKPFKVDLLRNLVNERMSATRGS